MSESPKDITTTSFGLLIAYIVPGVVGLFAASFWSSGVRDLLDRFNSSSSSVGLFFIVLFIALVLSLLVLPFRFVVYEIAVAHIMHLKGLGLEDFKSIGSNPELINAFRAVVDENYDPNICLRN